MSDSTSERGSVPVLLVHGFTTSALRTWSEPGWVDLISEAGRRVIAPDLLGHGNAAKPHDVEAYHYPAVEQLVLDQLPDGPVDAIGYSAGAGIVLTLAAENPERFGRIVVGGIGASSLKAGGSAIVDALEGHGDTDKQNADNQSADNLNAQHFRALAEADGNDPVALTAFIKRERKVLDAEMLASITSPVLFVIGDQDFAAPAEPLAELIANATVLTLRGVDHHGLPKAFAFVEKGLDFIGAAPF